MLFPKRVAETDSERLPLDGGGCRDLLMQQYRCAGGRPFACLQERNRASIACS